MLSSSSRRLCRRVAHSLYRPYAMWRMRKASSVQVAGQTLATDPQVFHPIYFHSTRLLIERLRSIDLAGKRFLDMGTGSGAVGLFAARQGAELTACDVNPRAVEVARENARRNGIRAEVVESNLFGALAGRQFDIICFNVPFYPQAPRTPWEAAFFAGPGLETVRRFAADCGRFLSPAGMVLVVFSEDSGHDDIVSMFAQGGLDRASETVATRLFERFHLVSFGRRAAT